MTLHEDTLVRRLCVGAPPQRKYNGEGERVAKPNPLNANRKPYVYGASPVSLRPRLFRYNNATFIEE